MCSAILAFVTHPPVLVVAHAEMDNIIGAGRTPTFDDEMQLPYIRASMSKISFLLPLNIAWRLFGHDDGSCF
jgi:hypothetical protein